MTREPRDYQVAGIKFLQAHKKAMLWDEFGLGKSYQAIAAAQKPVLVACPAYAMEQWRDEILAVYPLDSVSLCVGTRTGRTAALNANSDWVVINTEMIRDYEFKTKYNTFIIDEAHRMRGHVHWAKDKAGVNRRIPLQSAGAQDIAKRTPYVYLLTATPIKREADDLFMQLAIIDPKRFTSYHNFVQEYCQIISTGYDVKVCGIKDKDGLRALTREYALRRTYRGSGLQKPDVINHPVTIEPSKAWYKSYKRVKSDYRLEDVTFDSAAEVMRNLCRLTFDLKLDIAKGILDDNPECIFYVYYRESAHDLGAHLNIPVITGEQGALERTRVAKANKQLVATISSLSEGINLSHLNTVVFLETSYLPGDRDQALARVVRWSENIRPVGVFSVSVKNSIDTTKDKLIGRRGADALSIIRAELGGE